METLFGAALRLPGHGVSPGIGAARIGQSPGQTAVEREIKSGTRPTRRRPSGAARSFRGRHRLRDGSQNAGKTQYDDHHDDGTDNVKDIAHVSCLLEQRGGSERFATAGSAQAEQAEHGKHDDDETDDDQYVAWHGR